MTDVRLQIRVLPTIAEIPADDWNACASGVDSCTPLTASAHPQLKDQRASHLETISAKLYNPFISHEFLLALEDAGCVGGGSGWQPNYLIAETTDGVLVGAAPTYLKAHSRGEYVFDQGWADAYEQAGGHYYPKLQVAVPFTPATGPRLLARAGPLAGDVRIGLAQALTRITRQNRLSSAHITFLTEAEWRMLGGKGFLLRTDRQFHFDNPGYATFEDFLAALASRKRKTIRRERKEALTEDIEIHRLTGSDLTEEVWDAFFTFYMETGSRKWGRPYLTREFFSLIGERLADRILLIMARRSGRWIAGAINFIGAGTLYGRNWGAIEHHPFLHFEVCYYQAIEYAIDHGLRRVEAGAQGEHKLARGYLPSATYSAHYIAHPGLRRAIDDYLRRERAYVEAAGEELAAATPFRKDLMQNEEESG
jgi:predicted N-acyltransferase